MASLRIDVTAEHIADALPLHGQLRDRVLERARPIDDQQVTIDGGDGRGCIATIGQDAWTLVVDLPAAANAWLDERWAGAESEPFGFDLEVPSWVVSLVARSVTTDDLAMAPVAGRGAA